MTKNNYRHVHRNNISDVLRNKMIVLLVVYDLR